MHAEERQRECSQRHSEVWAGRLSGRFRLRAYRTVETGPISCRNVHHGIFPDVYFYTQSLQRPHERRPMASRREQVSALFFVAWTQRRLTECFPWATEGPNPPKKTLTFKKRIFLANNFGITTRGPYKDFKRLVQSMCNRKAAYDQHGGLPNSLTRSLVFILWNTCAHAMNRDSAAWTGIPLLYLHLHRLAAISIL